VLGPGFWVLVCAPVRGGFASTRHRELSTVVKWVLGPGSWVLACLPVCGAFCQHPAPSTRVGLPAPSTWNTMGAGSWVLACFPVCGAFASTQHLAPRTRVGLPAPSTWNPMGAGSWVLGSGLLPRLRSVCQHPAPSTQDPCGLASTQHLEPSIFFFYLLFYLAHTGVQFLPAVVNRFTCVPSASIVQICSVPLRVDMNAMCLPSGAQLGFSFRPAP